MLSSYDRLMRLYRLEARLAYKEVDRAGYVGVPDPRVQYPVKEKS